MISTLYKACKQLPYTIQRRVYNIEESGREKMKKIIKMVTGARKNANRRAKDENKYSSDTTTVPGMPNIPQKEQDTLVSPNQTPSNSTPSKNLHHSHPSNTEENRPDHGPRNTETISTQTGVGTRAKDKYDRPWRPHYPLKLHGHHHTTPNTRRKSSKTERSWSSKQGPTLSHISFLCEVILSPNLRSILRLRNKTPRLGLQYFNASTFHTICEQLLHTLQCQVYSVTTRARTSTERSAKNRDNDPTTDLDQTPSTSTMGDNQTHTKAKTTPKRRAKDKKTHPWRTQHRGRHLKMSDIRYQILKKRTKWTRSTKPCHINIRPQRAYPGKPKEQPVQWTPQYGIPPKNSNLTRGLALMLTLIIARHLMTNPPEIISRTLHLEQWAPAACTCPPLPRPPPEPPNPMVTGDIHVWMSSGPLRTATWPGQFVTWLRRLCSAWHDTFNNTILPLFTSAPQPEGMPLYQEDK